MTGVPEAIPRASLLHEDPLIYRRRWFLLGIMCLSLVMVVMSVAGLNVALPSIQRELGASASDLQWIVDANALLFAALLLTGGALGDRFGRKGALLIGLIIFAGGSLVGGLATGTGQLIVGRAITGLGAALVMPATLSMLTTIFPPDERRRAIAMWAGFAGAGAALGPIVSGALLQGFWWGSAVLVNIPVALAVIAAVWVFAPTSRDPEITPLDPAGAGLSLVGLGSLIYGIIEGPARGWSDPTVLVAFALAIAGLGAFVAWERRSAHPMLPLGLFRDRRLSVGSSVITAGFFVMFGVFFLFTLYVQFVRGYSPLRAGLATLPLALALATFSPRSAAAAERFGSGRVMAFGFAVIAAGLAVLSTVGPHTPYIVLALALALLGSGMSFAVAPATGSIMSAVPPGKAGVGSALNDTTREVGGALGIAIFGSASSALYRSAIDVRGLDLPPSAAEAAGESIGGADALANYLPNGADLATRAGVAFTHAFNLVAGSGVVLALVAAALVATRFNRHAETTAVGLDDDEASPDPVPASVG